MKKIIVLALFIGFFVGCTESKVEPMKSQPKYEGSNDDLPPLTYGCRAWVQTSKGSRRSMYRSSTASSHSKAIKEVRERYKEEYPGVRNFESNCWDCENLNLGAKERDICTREVCAR
jgi:hypothetical protein